MNFQVQWVDVNPFLAVRQQPTVIIPRAPSHTGKAWAGPTKVGSLDKFWVTQGNVITGEASMSVCQAGEAVRVPIWAYQTPQAAVALVVGLGLQAGIAALALLRDTTSQIPEEAYLYIGHECTDLRPAENSFRCYFGFAFRTK